jgi:hypothetical protein
MDSLQRWYGVFFDQKQLSHFILSNREKHVFELGCREEYLIGIPTLDNSVENAPPSLEEIFERKMEYDEDFDLVISPKDKLRQKVHPLQIVRVKGTINQDTEGLYNFLKEKKFNISKDQNLILVVAIDEAIQFNYITLGQKLKGINVPYGQIFILGQKKPDDSLIFFCCQVFPDIRVFDDIDFSVLLHQVRN